MQKHMSVFFFVILQRRNMYFSTFCFSPFALQLVFHTYDHWPLSDRKLYSKNSAERRTKQRKRNATPTPPTATHTHIDLKANNEASQTSFRGLIQHNTGIYIIMRATINGGGLIQFFGKGHGQRPESEVFHQDDRPKDKIQRLLWESKTHPTPSYNFFNSQQTTSAPSCVRPIFTYVLRCQPQLSSTCMDIVSPFPTTNSRNKILEISSKTFSSLPYIKNHHHFIICQNDNTNNTT